MFSYIICRERQDKINNLEIKRIGNNNIKHIDKSTIIIIYCNIIMTDKEIYNYLQYGYSLLLSIYILVNINLKWLNGFDIFLCF